MNIFCRTKNKIKTFEKNGIEYKIIKHRASKYLKIRLLNQNSITVTVPSRCTFKEAEQYIELKKDWIEENIVKCKSNIIDENFTVKENNLIITTGLIQKPVIIKSEDIVQFIYPIGADFYSKEIQNSLKEAIKKAFYIKAKEYFPKRLEELAQKFDFKYNKIALKTSKTRWGSCSYRNNINLNINLINLDDEYIDYVILHELCHTVEKNHGKGFWELLNKVMPNAKKIQTKLKKEKMII